MTIRSRNPLLDVSESPKVSLCDRPVGQRPLGLSGAAGDVALLEAARADVLLHAASILVHGDALDVRFERAVDGAMRVTH